MYRNSTAFRCRGRHGCVYKTVLIMKLTFILLTAGFLQVTAASFAQQVTLKVSNVSIKTIFEKIQEQTQYDFLYKTADLQLTGKLSLDLKNVPLKQALDKCFEQQPLVYTIENTTILVSRRPVPAAAADIVVRGKVTNDQQQPLPGVAVRIKDMHTGTVTDADGNFEIKAPNEGASLVFSFIGYESKEVKINDNRVINISLAPKNTGLDEVVVVGYGTQKRTTLTGAVSSVKGEQLRVGPVANISNRLGGNVAGVITRQASGEPGNDAASVLVRGTAPLVLVDGVERAYDKINPEDVESISVLKDASAVAPYGLRGANGVMLITTKRGKAGKLALNYNIDYGFQQPTNTPDFMNAYDGLQLRNEALRTDGRENEVIADDVLEQYKIGTDAAPNTDWIRNYMKSSNSQTHNLTLSGGTDLVRAYVSAGYFKQGSMFGPKNGYDRYNLRSNLDIKATKTTDVSLDINMTNDEKKTATLDAADIMLNLYRARATEADVFSNGLPAYQSSMGLSMHETIYGGADKSDRNNFQNVGFTVKQQLPFTKGLSVKGFFNYDRQEYAYKHWTEPVIAYTYNTATSEYIEDNAWLRSKPSLSVGNRIWTYYTGQVYLNYDRQFNKHGVSALAVYERRWGGRTELSASRSQYNFTIPELNMGSPNKVDQANAGTSNETAQDGMIFRANYNYDQKYLFEVAGRYDRSYRYAPDKRSAFFPSASLGWRISEESFIKDNAPAIDNLKLRVSYGKSGNPVGGEFAFLSQYQIRNSYVWGMTPIQEQGVYEGKEPNRLLTWETVWKANAGVDLSMWNGLLGLELDVYHDYRSDKILAPDAVVPIEYGVGLADENAGKEERYGVDVTLTNRTKLSKDLVMQHSGVFGFSRNRQIEIREAAGTYNVPQFRRTGLPSSQLRGYKSAGLFKDQADIDSWAYQNSSVLPGDIKYVDINGDGKINSEDQVVIGRTRVPEIMFGYNLGITYRQFDLGLFIQGAANSDYYLGYGSDGASGDRGVRFPFENDKPLKDHANSWSIDNQDPNAKFPRLSVTKRTHNYEVSDFWTVNSAYVKLKSLQIGYNFNPELTRKVFMKQVRAYANCYNLWTIYSAMPKDFDSENQAYNVYPQQFIVSFGLNVTF